MEIFFCEPNAKKRGDIFKHFFSKYFFINEDIFCNLNQFLVKKIRLKLRTIAKHESFSHTLDTND